MPTITNGTSTQPTLRRAPMEGTSRTRFRSATYAAQREARPGETDFYLTRSYAIVERLRRAVAERDEF